MNFAPVTSVTGGFDEKKKRKKIKR